MTDTQDTGKGAPACNRVCRKQGRHSAHRPCGCESKIFADNHCVYCGGEIVEPVESHSIQTVTDCNQLICRWCSKPIQQSPWGWMHVDERDHNKCPGDVAEPKENPLQNLRSEECAANGESHHYAANGPNGEIQCGYCGEPKPTTDYSISSLIAEVAPKAIGQHKTTGYWKHDPTQPKAMWEGKCACGSTWITNEKVEGCPTL